jgi:hypothetical protein
MFTFNTKRMNAMDKNSQPPVRETAKEARQGLLGKPILMVLIGGLFLAAVAWGVAEIYGESTDNNASQTNQENNPGSQNAQPDDVSRPSPDLPNANPPVDKDPTPQTGTGGDSQTKNPATTQP